MELENKALRRKLWVSFSRINVFLLQVERKRCLQSTAFYRHHRRQCFVSTPFWHHRRRCFVSTSFFTPKEGIPHTFYRSAENKKLGPVITSPSFLFLSKSYILSNFSNQICLTFSNLFKVDQPVFISLSIT